MNRKREGKIIKKEVERRLEMGPSIALNEASIC
jgi:hypothetical protein